MLTYIEPCGWCSSSISSLKHPSKSTESYRHPSLSSISSSQLSFSLSRKSLESHQKTAFSTAIIRSTYSHPHDYHSRKRIDELHERLDEIQIRNFLKFINYHLSLNKSDVNLQIDNFLPDLSNGHIFLDLIEKFSSTKLPREHGRTRFHSLTNVQHVLNYFKSHQQYINISSNDIVSGNRKAILALLWMIMKYFDFPNFRLMNRNCFQEKTLLSSGQDRSVLLNWLNNLLNQCLINQQNLLKDFYVQTWINGYYLSLILKYLVPISENYSTMKSFDYLKQLNRNSCEQCFEICLNLSNYCFHTSMIMNYDDKTEISLLNYFSDLQRNIFQLIQSDHLGKLIKINPYTKQVLQTIEQPTNAINVNEQYLVCIQETRKSDSIEVERLNKKRDKKDVVSDEDIDRLVLKVIEKAIEEITSNIDNNQTSICTNEKENVCSTVEVNEPMAINNPTKEITNVSIELPLVEEIHSEQLDQLQSEEQIISHNDENKQILEQLVPEITEARASPITAKEAVQPVIFKEETIQISSVDTPSEVVDQMTIEIPLKLIASYDEKETKYSDNEIEITSNDKFEEQIVPVVEPESIPDTNEIIEQITNTFAENVNNQTDQSIRSTGYPTRLPSIKLELSTVKEIHPQPLIPVVKELQQQPSIFVEKKARQQQQPVSVVKEVQQESPVSVIKEVQPQPLLSVVKEVQQPLIPMVKEVESQQPFIFAEKKSQRQQSSVSTIKKVQQQPVSAIKVVQQTSMFVEKKVQQQPVSVVKEVQQEPSVPVIKEAQQQQLSSSNGYKNSSTNRNKKFIPNNSHSQSTIIVDKPEVRQSSSEVSVQATVTIPVRCSKYSDVVNQSVPSMKKEQTVVPKKKVIPNESPKQSIIITEEIRAVPTRQPEPVQLASIPREQSKKSPNRNKKSRRSNAKKAQTKNTLITAETLSQPVVDDEPISLVVDDPEPIIEVETVPSNNENSSALRSRRSRKKKTIATKSTIVIEKTPSTNANANAVERNLFVVVKECIRDQKLIAFKCVIILVCLCFSIIILVLSHK